MEMICIQIPDFNMVQSYNVVMLLWKIYYGFSSSFVFSLHRNFPPHPINMNDLKQHEGPFCQGIRRIRIGIPGNPENICGGIPRYFPECFRNSNFWSKVARGSSWTQFPKYKTLIIMFIIIIIALLTWAIIFKNTQNFLRQN